MRILASRKDSVTDEEVVVSVSGVASSGLCNNSGINALLVGGQLDLPGKSSGETGVQYSSRNPNTSPFSLIGEGQCVKEKVTRNVWKKRFCTGFESLIGFLCKNSCVIDDKANSSSEIGNNNSINLKFEAIKKQQCDEGTRLAGSSSSGVLLDVKRVIKPCEIDSSDNLSGVVDHSRSKSRFAGQVDSERESTVSPASNFDIESNVLSGYLTSGEIPTFPVKEATAFHVEEAKFTNPQNLAKNTANIKIMRAGIYHEKQVKSLCALHALNNLLQNSKAFKQEDLDKICSELDPNSWVNPHKSVFGLGNYDINVIMTALQQKQLEAIWFDKRKDPSEELNFDNIYGFILNIPSDCRLGWLALPIKRKHWVAIRNLPSITEKDVGRSNYYNLDSKFEKPESIGVTDNLIQYLRGELKSPEKELFLVVTEDVGKLETWRKNPPSTSAASGANLNLLPVPTSGECSNCPDAPAGSGVNRRTSNDSGVVDLLPDLKDINVVDLNKEDLMRRQSSGVWSDLT